MQQFYREEFEGVISGITKWGMYVELSNTVEGLVHVVNMTDDHYEYDEMNYRMVGSHTHRTFELGQKVRIRVIGCDSVSRTIDFELVREERKREDGKDAGKTDCK